MHCLQIALLLLLTQPTGTKQSETIDYVFAGEDLSALGKETSEGRKIKDGNLKNKLKPSQGVTALLFRVNMENGKVTYIQIFYSKVGVPKLTLVREMAFTPTNDIDDFKLLMRAISLNE